MVGTRIWRSLEAEPETLRVEAQESLARVRAGYLTRNSHSIFLSLGSRSEKQAVLAGSISFLLSPPQPRSSSHTSASDLGPCLLPDSCTRLWVARAGGQVCRCGMRKKRRRKTLGKAAEGFSFRCDRRIKGLTYFSNVHMYRQTLTSELFHFLSKGSNQGRELGPAGASLWPVT